MGTHGVVANLPLSELAAEVSHGRGGAATLVELLGMGPLGSLHVTIGIGLQMQMVPIVRDGSLSPIPSTR